MMVDDDTNSSFYMRRLSNFCWRMAVRLEFQGPPIYAAYANRHTTQLNAIQTPLQGKQGTTWWKV